MVPRTAPRTSPRTVARTEDQTYDLSIGLHTYDVSYLAALRHPKLIAPEGQATLRHYKTYFMEGEKEWQIIACHCGEKLEWSGELLSTSIYSGGKGGGGAWYGSPKRGGLPKHSPTKGGRLPHGRPPSTPWPAMGAPTRGPHLLPTLPAICGWCPPPWAPPTTFDQMWAAPQRGPHQKTASQEKGEDVPSARTLRRGCPKNSGRSQNFSRTLQNILDAFQNFSSLMVYSETFPVWWFTLKHFRYLQNISGFLSETFPASPKLFWWLSLRLLTWHSADIWALSVWPYRFGEV